MLHVRLRLTVVVVLLWFYSNAKRSNSHFVDRCGFGGESNVEAVDHVDTHEVGESAVGDEAEWIQCAGLLCGVDLGGLRFGIEGDAGS